MIADNPVTTPGVDLETASVESTNKQYHFETEDKLQEQLALEYGAQVYFCHAVLLFGHSF